MLTAERIHIAIATKAEHSKTTKILMSLQAESSLLLLNLLLSSLQSLVRWRQVLHQKALQVGLSVIQQLTRAGKIRIRKA